MASPFFPFHVFLGGFYTLKNRPGLQHGKGLVELVVLRRLILSGEFAGNVRRGFFLPLFSHTFFNVLQPVPKVPFPKKLNMIRIQAGQPVHGLHLEVRRDALGLDVASGGRVIPRGRELDRSPALEGKNRLHRSFAECLFPNDYRAVVILQGARHDLACRGGSRVHEDHERALRIDAAGTGREADILAPNPPVRINNQALFEELIGNRHCLVEKPAGVIS